MDEVEHELNDSRANASSSRVTTASFQNSGPRNLGRP